MSPPLPEARGPLSTGLLDVLSGRVAVGALGSVSPDDADPFGDDVQLGLYVLYELHYQSFAGVDDDLEWNHDLLAFRAGLERAFLTALRTAVTGGDDVNGMLGALLVEAPDPTGPSHHLLGERGERWQLQEYVAHRSLYHLKEADPQAWAIPRLAGQAKASLVAVEFDEYGGGRAERMHAHLFAEMMVDLDLDPTYGAYLDAAPAATLATVNAMSMFGLHRALRGALIGQFANVEITSSPGSARLARAVQRLNAGAGTAFYAEHVEADAVHEQVVRRGVVAGLLADEPHLAADVVLGIQAADVLEARLADHLLSAWTAGRSSLRPAHAPALSR